MSGDIDVQSDPVLRRLADELEIRNVIARLAQLADTAPDDDLSGYLSLFTDDAAWVIGAEGGPVAPQERRGLADIEAGVRERRAAGVQGPGTHTRHLVSTIAVIFDSDDSAQAPCYWQFFRETSSGAPLLAGMGEYRNTFARTAAGWKLARRVIYPG
jgi:3-phenylpropionate/cinnamic acid dioxygenase small subunit